MHSLGVGLVKTTKGVSEHQELFWHNREAFLSRGNNRTGTGGTIPGIKAESAR